MSRWLLVLGLVSSGCSLTLSGPDPARPRGTAPQCDTGKGLVAMDGVMAAGLGVGALATLGSDSGSAAVVPILLGAAFVGAAIHGNSQVNACREAMSDFAQETTAMRSRPRRFRAPVPDEHDDDLPPRRTSPPTEPATEREPLPSITHPVAAPVIAGAPTTPAPTPASPAPPATPAAAPAAPAPAPVPSPSAAPAPTTNRPSRDAGRWHDFWREVR